VRFQGLVSALDAIFPSPSALIGSAVFGHFLTLSIICLLRFSVDIPKENQSVCNMAKEIGE
jgi:hypothetical protein